MLNLLHQPATGAVPVRCHHLLSDMASDHHVNSSTLKQAHVHNRRLVLVSVLFDRTELYRDLFVEDF